MKKLTLSALLGALLLITTLIAADPSLAVVGDLGKIVDSQGITSVRPKQGTRWSAACKAFAVKPGDWLRTDVRGANALAFRLEGGGQVILGPGTLVEVIDAHTIAFSYGEIEIAAAKQGEISVQAAEGQSVKAGERKVLRRAEGRAVELLKKDPNWLLGFKGAIPSESMGSLLAKVEGRDTALTLGYHKVNVDIRDGIARTVIEDSFVNHTSGRLEGTFYFPLPQDASIAGFGMWIGGELVEADVVEKQRAREIYETILRERRDPGLLEWTGGNLFKARVFPIEAHSEKRIKITYTQVLPLRGGKLRYSYGLQSEMLQQNPLRELSINVQVTSALPIRSFTCATHQTRISSTAHAAQAEFTAQEYTPTRDFEVEIDVDAAASPVVMIPHRRGDDGYILTLITPPGGDGNWQREVVPEGAPIHLLILADTSGSMNASARANQDALVASLLGSLGKNDRWDLATCDNEVRWFKNDQHNIDAARDFLAARNSLGWTDLDKAFTAAIERANVPNTHVVYIGDGVITTGDADPVAFANRLKHTYNEQKSSATFHAITPGSSYESGVLKAIASLGGGSIHKIAGTDTPALIARNLLTGIAAPGLRDIRIEFKGLQVARVYPENLPNLPAGSQQVIIGRYLPTGKDQTGEIIVTGTIGGKPVRFSAPINLKDAENGNSFIPRLWARLHLDVLLEQGKTQEIQDEIIALSEEYKIMTPYTSFLVLESDADRERFKVKKRFQMRDGERFFADGRSKANYELLQQQMRLAGTWRLNLQQGVLRNLSGLGRTQLPQVTLQRYGGSARIDNVYFEYGRKEDLGTVSGVTSRSRLELSDLEPSSSWSETAAEANESSFDKAEKLSLEDFAKDSVADTPMDGKAVNMKEELRDEDWSNQPRQNRPMAVGGSAGFALSTTPVIYKQSGSFRSSLHGADVAADGWNWRNSMGDLLSLFPRPISESPSPNKPQWSEEALTLAESLLRNDKIAALNGAGIAISQKSESSPKAGVEVLLSNNAWFVNSKQNGGDVQWWVNGNTRGHYFDALGLGLEQPANKAERLPFDLADYSLTSLAQSYPGLDAKIGFSKSGITELVLTNPRQPKSSLHFLIDTNRHVLVKISYVTEGKLLDTVEFSDFIELAGCWWARVVDYKDANDKTSTSIRRSITLRDGAAFQNAFDQALAPRKDIVFIHNELPTVDQAKKGKTSFESELVMFNHFAQSQQWERCTEHFESMQKFVGTKRGMQFLELRFLAMKRRNEEARTLAFKLARDLAAQPQEHDLFLVDFLNSEAQRVTNVNERIDFLQIVKPIYERADKHFQATKTWRLQMFHALQNTNRQPEAHKLLTELAEESPKDANLQTQYVNSLANQGDLNKALARLDSLLAKPADWQPSEIYNLRTTYLNLLENHSRIKELLAKTTLWLEDNTESPDPGWLLRYHLSALIRTGNDAKAYDLIEQWITDATKADAAQNTQSNPKNTPQNRAIAAVQTLCGRAYNVNRADIPERFHRPLANLVRRFALEQNDSYQIEMLMQDHRFIRTETARSLRSEFTKILEQRVTQLDLAQINRIYNWIACNDPAVDKQTWEKISNALIERWANNQTPERDNFAATIVRITSQQLGAGPYLGFLRRQLTQAQPEQRGRYAKELFLAILAQPHSTVLENEAFVLLHQISTNPEHPVAEKAGALISMDDWILNNGFQVVWNALEKKEELSRTELAEKRSAIIKSIREALSARLAGEQETESALTDWVRIERLYLDVALKRNPSSIAAECWNFLERQQSAPAAEERPSHEQALLERYVVTLEFLATQPKADPALADRLLVFLNRETTKTPETWKPHVYQLLVALNRPQALKETLSAWVKSGDDQWQVPLGYLLAELNDLPAAIALFQAAEKTLGPSEYKTLADWYLVLDQKTNRDRAILAYYQAMPDWQLSNLIQQQCSRLQNGFNNGTPENLDPAVVDMFKAIFKKAQSPQYHLSQLGELFRYTKDFRLLECVPEGIIGNSAQQIYPFLSQMDNVLRNVSDEATTDQLLSHLSAVRTRAITPIDQRGLDLLEMLVRRKAAEVLNQPGQHIPQALAAMQRAFKQEWGTGERLLMANFLADLGNIANRNPQGSQGPQQDQPPFPQNQNPHNLATEQLRELEILFQAETDLTRLLIAQRWSATLRGYGSVAKAFDILESSLDAYVADHDATLNSDSQAAFSQLIDWLEADQSFARAEKKIFAAMARDVNPTLRDWLVLQKFQMYTSAIGSTKGRVSLGEGEELYRNVLRDLVAELKTERNDQRYQLCNQLLQVFRIAHESKILRTKEDIVVFANGAFDQLPFETQNYQSLVQQLGNYIRDFAGDLQALTFLIERYEREPESFRAAGNGCWQQHGHAIAEYRSRIKDLGALEPRLLKIVLAELRRDLETQHSINQNIYYLPYSYFWREKQSAFQQLAEKIAGERKESIVALRHIATYLLHGLDARQVAINILVDAHRRGIQDEAGISLLAGFLENTNRHAEAVPYLREIVVLNPRQADYRRRLVTALALANQQDAAIAALDAAVSYFKENKLWQENSLALLAQACHDGKFWKQGVSLYDELVALHQRTQPNRGIGTGTLSHYYTQLSRCHSQLGNTVMAVDAAAGAIVSWGPTNQNRASALQSLKAVLAESKSLDTYVSYLEKSVTDSGLENPIVRKALGQLLYERKDYKNALRHLRLAAESQPGDLETQQALVSVYDSLNDADGALKQLLEAIALSPRNLALIKDLASRYEKLGRQADAERALTNLIEALPNESEGHSLLAEIRESQNRWSDAAQHWSMVASIRALEPTGLQRLANAQIKLGQYHLATSSLKKLLSKEWPNRFGDVHSQAANSLAEVQSAEKASKQ